MEINVWNDAPAKENCDRSSEHVIYEMVLLNVLNPNVALLHCSARQQKQTFDLVGGKYGGRGRY
jgi:hypothetical protein